LPSSRATIWLVDALSTYTPDSLAVGRRDGARRTGQFPFTRGIQPTMYRGRSGRCGSTPDSERGGVERAVPVSARARRQRLSVAFDLPTQMGYDSDHPLAAGEVGRVGVAIDSIEDMAALFDGIPLDRVSTSMTINATAIILLALYVAVARAQGAARALARGTIQNDILKEYVARGTFILSARARRCASCTDYLRVCERELPNWNTISISGYQIREAARRPCRKSRSRSRTPSRTSRRRRRRPRRHRSGSGVSFFFAAHNDSSRRSRSSARARRQLGAHHADGSARPTRGAQQLRFQRRPAAARSTAPAAGQQHRPRRDPGACARCSAARSRCTATAATKRWRCRPKSARIALRTQQIIAPKAASRTPSIRWPARMRSRR
jgi:methylmalonyl-CoA mutase N-terminal domain/subunit